MIIKPMIVEFRIHFTIKISKMYIGLGTVVLIIILYLIFRRR